MSDAILVINAGSSSLKFSVLETDAPDHRRVLRGQIEGIGSAPRLVARDAEDDVVVDEPVPAAAEGDANLMLPILKAVTSLATLGEICDTLRAVWGEYEMTVM